jgi:hypothetical protein
MEVMKKKGEKTQPNSPDVINRISKNPQLNPATLHLLTWEIVLNKTRHLPKLLKPNWIANI